ncbi:hypothetical protein [Limosilactobacillus reuteri]|uniref:hypothetical protein n=1 Tax=Limosilactobacillus reuteri TaxID=1598 RepID=UPI001CDAAFC2|nr:hypothetical protein [Limosilactobacillus reuteri]
MVSIKKQASRHLQKEQLRVETHKKMKQTLSGFSKRKKKNRKNKGIRLKHRRKNNEN